MVFNGFTPSTLTPVWIALAVIIAILYLFRVRRRRVDVAYLGLWREVLDQSKHRRWYDWFKRLLSFLLWMVIVGLVLLALLDPREEEDTTAHRHAVIIIDSSASMNTVDEGSECGSRFACAVADARELVEKMKPTDRAVIIQSSGIVGSVSGPFSQDKEALDLALERLKPGAVSTDIGKALDLAGNLIRERENPEIFLFTDGLFSDAGELSGRIPGGAAFEQRTYGKPAGNVSIEAFNVRRYIANRMGFEVFFKVRNRFERPVTVKVRILNLGENESVLRTDGVHSVLAEKTLTLASGSSEVRLYENLTLESSRMAATVELTGDSDVKDPLGVDDVAYARIPDYAKPDILCVTPGNLFLEAALLLNENYHVSFVKPADVEKKGADGGILLSDLTASHDIVILDNSYGNLGVVDASESWRGKVIFIHPEAAYSPFKVKEVVNPVIERVNGKHDVARWLSLKNLNIARANVFQGVSSEEMVMRAIEGPLMATRSTGDQRLLAIGFSLVESDLIFRVGLPILFINGIDWLMNEDSEPVRGYPTGDSYHIQVPDGWAQVDLVRPDGSQMTGLPVYDGAVTVYGEFAGFYRLTNPQDEKSRVVEIAANFIHSSESDLWREPENLAGNEKRVTTLGAEAEDSEEEESLLVKLLSGLPSSSQYIWVLALLIAMGLVSVEWLTYHRRWTV